MNYNFLPITKPFPKWTEERFYGLKSSEAQFFYKTQHYRVHQWTINHKAKIPWKSTQMLKAKNIYLQHLMAAKNFNSFKKPFQNRIKGGILVQS